MNNQILAIIGSQYGDEGKGKFVDLLSKDYDYVVRYQGGDNAGHSIVIDGKKYKLRLIPSGVFNPKNKVVIGNGAVINVKTLLKEIEYLKQEKFSTSNLFISDRAQVLLDYHIELDKLNEEILSANKIGTTLNGIGPCYSDKVARIGVRVVDLFDKKELLSKITASLSIKNLLFKQYKKPLFDPVKLTEEYYNIGKKIKPLVTDTIELLNKAYVDNKKILFEGAQGVMLDIDFGTYPFVTSSNVVGLVSGGSGIGITKIQNVLTVAKAYCTRVGNGPFASEIKDKALAHEIREKGHEYGTVTKRPRRIGWLDLTLLRYSCNVSGATEIAITLLDVLSGIKELKICIGYMLNNKKINYIPANLKQYAKCKPIFKSFKPWKEDISNIKKYNDLPIECKKYIEFIEETLNIKVTYASVGADRIQTIKRDK